jgi:hypothetical protein
MTNDPNHNLLSALRRLEHIAPDKNIQKIRTTESSNDSLDRLLLALVARFKRRLDDLVIFPFQLRYIDNATRPTPQELDNLRDTVSEILRDENMTLNSCDQLERDGYDVSRRAVQDIMQAVKRIQVLVNDPAWAHSSGRQKRTTG